MRRDGPYVNIGPAMLGPILECIPGQTPGRPERPAPRTPSTHLVRSTFAGLMSMCTIGGLEVWRCRSPVATSWVIRTRSCEGCVCVLGGVQHLGV